jgi:hypothetical protein
MAMKQKQVQCRTSLCDSLFQVCRLVMMRLQEALQKLKAQGHGQYRYERMHEVAIGTWCKHMAMLFSIIVRIVQ